MEVAMIRYRINIFFQKNLWGNKKRFNFALQSTFNNSLHERRKRTFTSHN
jgi:hypothetical protein